MSLGKQALLFWRVALATMLVRSKDITAVIDQFTALASSEKTKPLQKALLLFFKAKLGPWTARLDVNKVGWLSENEVSTLLKRVRAVQMAL